MNMVLQNGVARCRSILVALFLVAASAVSVHAGELVGKVVGVIDGDTVDVLDDQRTLTRVRLAGIDAPEKAMPYGQRAKQYLSDLVYMKDVRVITEKVDRYGRTVGKVIVNDHDASLAMVTAGLAWHYKRYSSEQSPDDRSLYAAAEGAARHRRLGLWQLKEPTPPWEWRAARR